MVDAQASENNKEDTSSQKGRERSQMEELKFMIFSVIFVGQRLNKCWTNQQNYGGFMTANYKLSHVEPFQSWATSCYFDDYHDSDSSSIMVCLCCRADW